MHQFPLSITTNRINPHHTLQSPTKHDKHINVKKQIYTNKDLTQSKPKQRKFTQITIIAINRTFFTRRRLQ